MASGPRPVHIRIERDLLRAIDHLCAEYDLYRTDAIEMLLEAAIDAIEEGEWDMEQIAEEFWEEKQG